MPEAIELTHFPQRPDNTVSPDPLAAPGSEGTAEPPEWVSQLPSYLRDNLTAGPSKQDGPVVGADLLGGPAGLYSLVPELRGNEVVLGAQEDIINNVTELIGKNAAAPYRIRAGNENYELTIKAEFQWDDATMPDAEADPTAAKAKGKTKSSVTDEQSSSREQHLDLSAAIGSIPVAPPVSVFVTAQLPIGPNSAAEGGTERDVEVENTVETKSLRKVEVPVKITYALTDSRGRTIGPAGRSGEEMSVTGQVPVKVPTEFREPDDEADPPVPVMRPLPKDAPPEAVYSRTPDGSFYDQVAEGLPRALTEIGAAGRETLQNFFSDANLKARWQEMAVFVDPGDPDSANLGWVRSDDVAKGPYSKRWFGRPTIFEMRAVAQTVQVVESLADAESTTKNTVEDTVTKQTSTKRPLGGSALIAATPATGLAGVALGLGPGVGVSFAAGHGQENRRKMSLADSVVTTGQVIRFKTVHRLEVRQLGGEGFPLDGWIEAFQTAPSDRVERAGLQSRTDSLAAGDAQSGRGGEPRGTFLDSSSESSVDEPTFLDSASESSGDGPTFLDSSSESSGNESAFLDSASVSTGTGTGTGTGALRDEDGEATENAAPRQVYAPRHIEELTSIGGAFVEDLGLGDALYNRIAEVLRRVPGRRWHHLTRGGFVVEFDDPKLSGGLKPAVEALLKRRDAAKTHLSEEQLSRLVDTMLTDRGLSFQLVKAGTFRDYTATVTLKATMDDLRDLPATPDGTTFSRKTESAELVGLSSAKKWDAKAGPNVSAFMVKIIGALLPGWESKITGGWSWSRSTAVRTETENSTTRTHGDSLTNAGKIGSQGMQSFSAGLTIASRVTAEGRMVHAEHPLPSDTLAGER
ncbi:hypothetical protein ABT279_45660, partial [Amycolatopsis sp. NPDC000673]|uniref:hypothetical protein n=1 Tax=Amycolatopsis sp. NPDC000673 TaxID=3154267 RepID=UPI003332DAA4